MKGTHRTVLAFGAIAALSLLAGCQSGGEVVAVVNGESITKDDYYRYLELKPDVRVILQNDRASLPVDGTLGFQAVQDLIAQRLTMQLAKDKKIYPNEKEITDEIAFQKKLKPQFLAQLTGRGLTMDMIRESLALDLIQEKLLTQGIEITEADVQTYVKNNPNQFVEPERIDMRWILVKDDRTRAKVDQEIGGGQSFPQLAPRYSAATDAKESRGKLIDRATGGPPALRDLPPAVQQALTPLKEGQMTDWIRFPDGHAKFLLEKRIASKKVVMDDARKEFLRRLLAKQEGSKARDIDKQILGKMRESKIEVKKREFKDPWDRAYEQYKTQNKLDGMTGAGR